MSKSLLRCCICNKSVSEEDSIVCCGTFGAQTNRYCKKCHAAGLEPYNDIVDYIACVGYFPNDINEQYQSLVRNMLKKLNISEEKFIEDVNKRIIEFENMFDGFSVTIDEAAYDELNEEELFELDIIDEG